MEPTRAQAIDAFLGDDKEIVNLSPSYRKPSWITKGLVNPSIPSIVSFAILAYGGTMLYNHFDSSTWFRIGLDFTLAFKSFSIINAVFINTVAGQRIAIAPFNGTATIWVACSAFVKGLGTLGWDNLNLIAGGAIVGLSVGLGTSLHWVVGHTVAISQLASNGIPQETIDWVNTQIKTTDVGASHLEAALLTKYAPHLTDSDKKSILNRLIEGTQLFRSKLALVTFHPFDAERTKQEVQQANKFRQKWKGPSSLEKLGDAFLDEGSKQTLIDQVQLLQDNDAPYSDICLKVLQALDVPMGIPLDPLAESHPGMSWKKMNKEAVSRHFTRLAHQVVQMMSQRQTPRQVVAP